MIEIERMQILTLSDVFVAVAGVLPKIPYCLWGGSYLEMVLCILLNFQGGAY